MATNEFADIQSIHDFKSLVKYLRKELNWPIDEETPADDLTFEYRPAELGIDDRLAVKIREIKQLRPLTGNQPWGVFWIKFERKQLPVVIMRRILSALVRKQRGQKGHQKTWDVPDLMFISATGEGDDRGISFAHFHEVDGKPQLRTFAWDVRETHLYYIKNLNLNALRWPSDNGRDINMWRQQWSEAFTVAHRYVPTTAEMLAKKMAQIASYIREAVKTVYRMEHAGGSLHQLHHNLKLDLISDLSEDDFADMYAQTVTYGLFAARATRSGDFSSSDTKALIEHTNPFLRELLEQMMNQQALDLDELGVTELTDLLGKVNMEAILQSFGRQKRGEDPVIHFYETFMREYDPEQKAKRGEFYTPDAVVSFIVRSVDYLLRTKFDCADGLATALPNAEGFQPIILDPATGTGTFLKHVIEVIWEAFYEKNKRLANTERSVKWNQFVRENILPRLYAFELKMSPYTIAHMKVGLALQEKGFEFTKKERLQIYLTNALQPAHEIARVDTAALAHEAQQANTVKNKAPINVVIGNPPYSNFGMMNKGDWILGQLEDYKKGLQEKKINIDDDFIKFIRFAQWTIDRSGKGIIGFITNNSYIDGLTHRVMRGSLLKSFNEIYVLDLHGSAKRQFSQQRDENVFDIQQGVAIVFMVRSDNPQNRCRVFYSELFGSREEKYEILLRNDLSSVEWQEVQDISHQSCLGKFQFFTPKAMDNIDEYCAGWSLRTIFSIHQNGIKTDRDELFFDVDAAELKRRMNVFYSRRGLEKSFAALYRVENSSSYDLISRRAKTQFSERNIRKCLYRPFDERWLYYAIGLTSRPAWDVMQHMLAGKNIALLSCRQQAETGFQHVFCTDVISECCAVSLRTREITSVFPLYVFPAGVSQQQSLFTMSIGDRRSNLSEGFVKDFSIRIKLSFLPDGEGDLYKTFGPENVFHYIYAVFHSPTYRTRYAEFLKIDFPRLPLVSNVELFRQLCALGKELVALHLLEASVLNAPITKFKGKGDNMVAKGHPKYQGGAVLINSTQCFEGVPENVWEFHIGGYQVCHKWLKDRRGRELSADDIAHYQKIVVALKQTIRLMGEVDAAIDAHGGWPIK